MPNQLIHETSPYLLQHAHNPVEWYPWGEAALQKARNENRPILVSIGYSACHWCHVMERESFENQQIAEIMNEHLVCIKVDREERPDVDAIYMDALHAMGVQGGWPLNVFLMPDARPFYGGTYFPPQKWANLVMGISKAFDESYDKLQESADGFTENMLFKESDKYKLEAEDELAFSEDELTLMFNRIRRDFDYEKGGMNRAPKFPMPAIWKFLLRYYDLTRDPLALQQLRLTLDRLSLGGIYDILGGGWTRYSTDEDWKVPHFEKMLYDNGQLVSLYAEAYALTRDELYKDRIGQTIGWLKRELTSEEGGFYSALDADSEGEEGRFYVWSKQETDQLLGDDAALFNEVFEITDEGNWEHGNNILHLENRLPQTDGRSWNELFDKLLDHRSTRVRPGLDDKILCSWNGLMLKGLVDAYRYVGEPEFLEMALANAAFIKTKMTTTVQTEEGKEARGLWHNYKNGQATLIAYLEDYASVIAAYTALYQVTFDEQWLREAEMLTDYTMSNFYDADDEFFYFTDSQGEALIARKKELFDNVVPASNSMMAENLYQLGLMLDRQDFTQTALLMLGKMKRLVLKDPQWLSNWATLAARLVKPTAEVAIAGADALAVRAQIDQTYAPNIVLAGTTTTSDLPLLQNRSAADAQTLIYVCFNKTCQLPTPDVAQALQLIKQ